MYTDNIVDQEAVKAEVQNQLKSLGLLGDEDQRKAEPIVMNLGGKDYTFDSLEQAQESINSAFSSIASNQAAMLQQLEDAQRAQAEKSGGTAPESTFSKDKFLELISSNPIEAFNYIDEIRYGPDRVPPQVKEQLGKVPQLEHTITAYRFTQAHPEFENSDANANILRAVGQQLGLPINTYEGLESAYKVAQSFGVLQARQAEQQPPSGGFANRGQGNYTPAPPSISRGNSGMPENDVEGYLDTLSMEQLQALMR